jgi:hypothetical protein
MLFDIFEKRRQRGSKSVTSGLESTGGMGEGRAAVAPRRVLGRRGRQK